MALIKDDYVIAGTTVEIHATENGDWRIIEPGEESHHVFLGNGETLKQAVAKARTQLAKRKVVVEVPFISREGEHGIAYGVHGKTSKPLVRYENGKSMPYEGYKQPFKPDTPVAVINRYNEIREIENVLAKEKTQIEREHEFHLVVAVRDAMAAAAEQEVATA